MIISGNQQFLRTLNRLAVLRAVRLNAGISRVKLADSLSLTRPTIGNLVDELISDGWLNEERLGPTGSLGRRPVALHIDEASRILIGADVNHERVICIATTLSGEIRELSVTPSHSGEAGIVLDILAQQISSMSHRLSQSGGKISAVGIGMPGPVDVETGTLLYSDNTGWTKLPVRAILAERLSQLDGPLCPLLVQRAVGCVALYHFEFERRTEEEPLLYVHVGHSVTSAIVTRYSLMRGHRGMTGAIGHTVIDPEGPLCNCGKHGCANMLVTLRAIQNATGKDSDELRSTALANDAAINKELQHAGELFGTLLHNLCMQFDPARLFVGGPAFQIGEEYLNAARSAFLRLHEPSGIKAPRIEVVRHDTNAVALGAATGALYSLVKPIS